MQHIKKNRRYSVIFLMLHTFLLFPPHKVDIVSPISFSKAGTSQLSILRFNLTSIFCSNMYGQRSPSNLQIQTLRALRLI